MSQRDDLIAGAKVCIARKGFGGTTARDIAAESGANLASIGYYFGSKDALLLAATLEAMNEWGDTIEEAMTFTGPRPGVDRLEEFLDRYFASLEDQREVVIASIQALAQAEYSPELRRQVGQSHEEGRRSLTAVVLDIDPQEVAEDDLPLGSVVLALINGYSLQWYISGTLPTAAEVADVIRNLAASRGGTGR